MNARRARTAANVALGYAADSRGRGIAYAAIAGGSSTAIVRLTFAAQPIAALEGRQNGYAAITAVAEHLKSRGFGRVRIRLGDPRVAAELNGSGTPPRALAMAYVRVRCLLNSVGRVRLEVAEPIEIRDLATRAQAEVSLLAAA